MGTPAVLSIPHHSFLPRLIGAFLRDDFSDKQPGQSPKASPWSAVDKYMFLSDVEVSNDPGTLGPLCQESLETWKCLADFSAAKPQPHLSKPTCQGTL
jgi:hypothetical protein